MVNKVILISQNSNEFQSCQCLIRFIVQSKFHIPWVCCKYKKLIMTFEKHVMWKIEMQIQTHMNIPFQIKNNIHHRNKLILISDEVEHV